MNRNHMEINYKCIAKSEWIRSTNWNVVWISFMDCTLILSKNETCDSSFFLSLSLSKNYFLEEIFGGVLFIVSLVVFIKNFIFKTGEIALLPYNSLFIQKSWKSKNTNSLWGVPVVNMAEVSLLCPFKFMFVYKYYRKSILHILNIVCNRPAKKFLVWHIDGTFLKNRIRDQKYHTPNELCQNLTANGP